VSRSKEAATGGFTYRPGARGARGGFRRCTPAHPCPICGREKLCSIGERAVLCSRASEGAVGAGENECGPYYVHPLDGVPQVQRAEALPVEPTTQRAPPDVRDRAYRAALAQLRLDDADRAGLVRRGLDVDTIARGSYRSLNVEGRARVARAVVDAVGEASAAEVPGIYRAEADGRSWWSFGGSAGLVIPVRDLDGRVVALKIRRREADADPRYLYVTSAKRGGATAEIAAHVPAAALALRASSRRLVLTEGELKADVATALLGEPVVSIPGVGAWRAGVELARAWGAHHVRIALDHDEKPRARLVVARAALSILGALRADGFNVSLWQWEGSKGLDDMALAARAIGAGVP
jgi:hypothetical protein